MWKALQYGIMINRNTHAVLQPILQKAQWSQFNNHHNQCFEIWIKWQTFCRWHIQKWFLGIKILRLDTNFTEDCSIGFTWECVIIGFGKGSVLNRRWPSSMTPFGITRPQYVKLNCPSHLDTATILLQTTILSKPQVSKIVHKHLKKIFLL